MSPALTATRRLPGQRASHTITGRLVAIECGQKLGLSTHQLRVRLEDADGDETTLAGEVICHAAFGRHDSERAAAFAARVHTYLQRRVRVTASVAPYAGATATYLLGVTACELVREARARRAA